MDNPTDSEFTNAEIFEKLNNALFECLNPDGLLKQIMGPKFEPRLEQFKMASSVLEAIQDQKHLVVEAGTGVGKSFGYLIPTILYAIMQKKRVVISTHTIALQEQLIKKDLPRLQKILPKFKAVLVKGRSNYVSLRLLDQTMSRAGMLFEKSSEEFAQLNRIAEWVQEEKSSGSLSDLDFRPHSSVWENISSQSDNCLGNKCNTFRECFYYRARRGVSNAQILIVNHSLFFSDLAIRRASPKNSILPNYDIVVFDEAHTVPAVAVDHFGIRVSQTGIDYQLSRLRSKSRADRGIIATYGWSHEGKLVEAARKEIDPYFHKVWDHLKNQNKMVRRVFQPLPGTPLIGVRLEELAYSIVSRLPEADTEEKNLELNSLIDRLLSLRNSINFWHKQNDPQLVYWIEGGFRQRRKAQNSDYPKEGLPDRFEIVGAPLDVGKTLRNHLFENGPLCIMTSATLAVDQPPKFDFFHNQIGFDRNIGKSCQFDSPFNYQKQARLVVYPKMADPSSERDRFFLQSVILIKLLCTDTRGKTLVLFTSYDMMHKMAAEVRKELEEENIRLLTQGEGLPVSAMIETFKKGPPCILFGTDSFWQGIDIPGDHLTQLIVVRLPFSVPDHPLLEARDQRLKADGGNPFMEFHLPEAITKLRQGFGRLIRTATDHGTVHILDPRITTKHYGKMFLKSLPDCPVLYSQ